MWEATTMKMKALVKKYAKEGLWLEEVDKPEIGPFDCLIKIKKTAICGTDTHLQLGRVVTSNNSSANDNRT